MGRMMMLAALVAALVCAGCGGDKKPKDGGDAPESAAQTAAAAETGADVDTDTGADADNSAAEEPGIEPDAKGYITDPRDGKRYRTVKAGGLMWMAENLNYGSSGYGVCYGEAEENCAKYGRLYQSSYTKEACPEGWRLPGVREWDDLFIAAGGSYDDDKRRWNDAGKKLKAKKGWNSGGSGTDDFGFSALPGGFREGGYSNNDFRFAGMGGYWWADDDIGHDRYRAMGWDMNYVNENRIDWGYAFSVRCVRGRAADPAPGVGRPSPAAPEIKPSAAAGEVDTRWYRAGKKEFTISSAGQLAGMAQLLNGGTSFHGVTVGLSADIDLSAFGKGSPFNGGKGWVPIGAGCENSFEGTFNGNGHKIRGLYINDPNLQCAGLFGMISSRDNSNGHVNNLGVVDVDITAGNQVGAIAGRIAGNSWAGLSLSYSSGTVNGVDYVGGLAGGNHGGRIATCYSAAKAGGDQYVGGLAGYNNGMVIDSYSTGAVRGTTDVGGVVGVVYGDDVTAGVANCYSTGAVSGRGGRVGGVAGRVRNASVNSCYSISAVSGREGTGGIAGSTVTGGKVTNCAALNPSVTGVNTSTGRVVGYIQGTYSGYEDELSKNLAFAGMKNRDGKADKWTVKGEDAGDGADISSAEISADGTFGYRFTAETETSWKTENGKLPGMNGKTVEMPAHLK
ncbi:MAG: hypothetical protein FWB85_09740 [Chitinispirillia bacterium]|nr:hypothetical protein [Chitinispirillia bacterium]MCL2242481.1 hypothetical protein [Chitinispirillia bacterium]